MSFAAAMGIAQVGTSLYGSYQANKRANAQMALQQRQMAQQREFQNRQLGLARDAQRSQEEENAYQRQIEQMNRLIAQQERGYQKNLAEDQREQLLEERRADIDRQMEQDRAAAKQRQFEIEQLLKTQDLKEDEREFAIEQLNEAKAVAAGERDEDMRRFLEERAMAQANRDFMLGEYSSAKQQADAERQRDLMIQNQIMSQAGNLQQSLQATANSMGDMPEIERLSRGDIRSEIDRRTNQYQADVDRAADRVASVNEADLIRGGIDESTTGTARRGEVAARLSQEYQNARQRAYDDALGYITGRQQTMATNAQNIMDRRQQVLGETADINSAEMNILQNLRNAQSAQDAYAMAARVPDGIYNRQVNSANDYRAPVSINSAAYNNRVSSGISGMNNIGSVVSNAGFNVDSAITGATRQNIPSASGYYNNAQSVGNNLLNNINNNAAQARQDAINAGQGFGEELRNLSAEYGDTIDSAFSRMFDTTGSYKSYGGGAPPSVRGIGK